MSMSENKAIEYKFSGLIDTQPVASGEIHIYKAALLNFNANGYLKLGADTSGEAFAGVAMNELVQATGLDLGYNSMKFMRAGSKAIIENVTINTAVDQSNLGDNVYVMADDAVDLTGGSSNKVLAGTIFNIKSSTLIDVQI